MLKKFSNSFPGLTSLLILLSWSGFAQKTRYYATSSAMQLRAHLAVLLLKSDARMRGKVEVRSLYLNSWARRLAPWLKWES